MSRDSDWKLHEIALCTWCQQHCNIVLMSYCSSCEYYGNLSFSSSFVFTSSSSSSSSFYIKLFKLSTHLKRYIYLTCINLIQCLEHKLSVVHTTTASRSTTGPRFGERSGGRWSILLQFSLSLPGIHWFLLPPELCTSIQIAESLVHRCEERPITSTHYQTFNKICLGKSVYKIYMHYVTLVV